MNKKYLNRIKRSFINKSIKLKINRKIWSIESFSWKKPHPPWICPLCNVGILKGDRNSLTIEQSQATIKAKYSPLYDIDAEASFRFAGFMVCTNSFCKEKIAVAGKGRLHAATNDEPVGVGYRLERYSVYKPLFFEPALKIFIVPESTPSIILEQINKSFSHFFNDLSACANAIRTTLELIMDEQGMQKMSNSGKMISLGTRIDNFNRHNPKVKPFLEAAKWIGNAGSHVEGIEKDAILDGYELLQYIVNDLYEDHRIFKELSIKAEKINSSKKPLS